MGQFGLAKQPDGSNGTTPEVLQAVNGALWENTEYAPMLRGGEVSGRTDMSYDYTAGVGLKPTPFGAIYVTWQAGQTALVSSPAAARFDIIWADEFGVHVSTEGSQPSSAVILGRRRLPASATSTNASTSVYSRDWALPYGSKLGWLAEAEESWTYGTPAIQNEITWGALSFYVPTDRNVSIKLLQALYAEHQDTQPDTWDRLGVMRYKLFVDNTFNRTVEIEYNRTYDIAERNLHLFGLAKGQHTIHFLRKKQWGAPPIHFGAGNEGYQKGFVGVMDEGLHQ